MMKKKLLALLLLMVCFLSLTGFTNKEFKNTFSYIKVADIKRPKAMPYKKYIKVGKGIYGKIVGVRYYYVLNPKRAAKEMQVERKARNKSLKKLAKDLDGPAGETIEKTRKQSWRSDGYLIKTAKNYKKNNAYIIALAIKIYSENKPFDKVAANKIGTFKSIKHWNPKEIQGYTFGNTSAGSTSKGTYYCFLVSRSKAMVKTVQGITFAYIN